MFSKPVAARYYRSVKPCVHYVPFFHRAEDDIIDVVHELRKPGAPTGSCDVSSLYRPRLRSVHRTHFVHRALPLRLEWFAENDLKVQRIAERGGEFARQWTTRSARLKYWQRALERYAELFKDYSNDLDLEKMF